MEKIKLFFATLKNTWKIINEEKNEAKIKVKCVNEFLKYLNEIYIHICNMRKSIDVMCEFTVNGKFKNQICEIYDNLCNYGITVFDENYNMSIVQAYSNEGHILID